MIEFEIDEYGNKHWYKDGELHRADGPAIEGTVRDDEWWYKGIFAGEGDHPDPVLWERLTSVALNGGPLLNGCIVDPWGSKYWYKDDKRHREDGPAVDRSNEYKLWYLDGELLGKGAYGFWKLWDWSTEEQRGNPTLLRYLPR